MTALDSVTSFETVQFIIVVGLAGVALATILPGIWRKTAEADHLQRMADKQLTHDHEMDKLRQKDASSAVPGKSLALKGKGT